MSMTLLISGAGIAGPTLAYWLRAAGFTPTLVERAPAPRDGGYVIDFWGLGYDIAERMGLADAIDRIGYHVREMRLVDDRGRRAAGFGTRVFDELTQGRYVTLPRSDLARLLLERIAGDTEVIYDDEIIALRDAGGHVRVTLRRAGERRFNLVIGADGLHSGVRRLAFGASQEFETPLGYAVAAFEAGGYRPRDEDAYLIYGQPGRMLGRATLRDDRTLFLFVFRTDGAAFPTTLDARKAMLRDGYGEGQWECAPILEALDRAPDLYFDRVSQIRMKRWSKGRIALVGDAAFCPSLVAGQGSALAMGAAYVLAGELAAAGGRHELAFARYEAVLRAFIDAKQRAAARFAAVFAPKTHFGLFLRTQAMKAFAIPGLARFTIGRDISDRLQLPDYPWAV